VNGIAAIFKEAPSVEISCPGATPREAASEPIGNREVLERVNDAGLEYGTGFGLRIRQGKAFVVRGDVAWSPDDRPIAGYFTAGHTF
jgi:hypothetical protein